MPREEETADEEVSERAAPRRETLFGDRQRRSDFRRVGIGQGAGNDFSFIGDPVVSVPSRKTRCVRHGGRRGIRQRRPAGKARRGAGDGHRHIRRAGIGFRFRVDQALIEDPVCARGAFNPPGRGCCEGRGVGERRTPRKARLCPCNGGRHADGVGTGLGPGP